MTQDMHAMVMVWARPIFLESQADGCKALSTPQVAKAKRLLRFSMFHAEVQLLFPFSVIYSPGMPNFFRREHKSLLNLSCARAVEG